VVGSRIEEEERGGAEAGAAGEVGCVYIGSFCEGVGCRLTVDRQTQMAVSHQEQRASRDKNKCCFSLRLGRLP